MNGLDVAVFRAVNGWPESLRPVFVFLSEATKTTYGLVLIAVAFVALVWWKPSRTAAIIAVLSWPLANAATDVLKYGLRWNRPSWPEVLAANPDFHVRGEPLTSFGTASAHSANMMAVAVVFLWLCRPAGYGWLVVAVLTGLSRIYVGVHWPSEVVFGWFTGALCATVVVKTIEAWKRLRAPATSVVQEGPAAES
ncbi:MAG: phosphatase PAP2 family protein [Armatimonadetes bacterium]|nr:phosphatase PAP2 family protein [Armatimonadota bacterium]